MGEKNHGHPVRIERTAKTTGRPEAIATCEACGWTIGPVHYGRARRAARVHQGEEALWAKTPEWYRRLNPDKENFR